MADLKAILCNFLMLLHHCSKLLLFALLELQVLVFFAPLGLFHLLVVLVLVVHMFGHALLFTLSRILLPLESLH